MMKNIDMAFQYPKYWSILNDYDKYQYNCLRATLSVNYAKNQRNKRVENFTEILEIIKRFCVRGDGDDWRRFLACGYCCIPSGIAINTRQLKLLVFKCKSSINGSLHKMGLSSNVARAETTNQLLKAIPVLRENVNELRQWTIRQYTSIPRLPNSPPTYDIKKDISQPEVSTIVERNECSISQVETPKKEMDTIESHSIAKEIFDMDHTDELFQLFDLVDNETFPGLDFI